MEVHHHSHLASGETHTSRKKFTHYLWEFLMLFLAVFCGFLAENQREHIVEGRREKEYIRSMIEDLKLDTAGFAFDNSTRSATLKIFDSSIMLLNREKRSDAEQQRLYYLARMGLRLSPFPEMNDKTFEQMKSSGNLRLIHDSKIANSITSYYFNSKEFSINKEQMLLRLQSLLEMHAKVFNGAVLQQMINNDQFEINPPPGTALLMTDDKEILNELAVRTHYVASIIKYSRVFIDNLHAKATQLIRLLQEEYHLE